jgi:hypothetical protein
MQILAIDQSMTHSAAVLLSATSNNVKLTVENTEVFKPKSTGIHRVMDFSDWAHDVVERSKPHIFAREMHRQRLPGAGGTDTHYLGAHLDSIAWNGGWIEKDLYYMIPPTSWKKFITGKGVLKKDTAYLVHLNKALVDCDWVYGPSRMIENDNIADAMCIGITAWIVHCVNTGMTTDALFKYQKEALKKSTSFIDYGERA